MKQQPKLKIKKGITDKVMDLLTLFSVIATIVFPLVYYSDLPKQIPLHFDSSGNPDRIGSRKTIWILPLLGAVLCFGIFRLIQFPHLFNYPGKITAENAERLYRISQRSLRVINLVIAVSLAYITYETIFTALGRSNGLNSGFLIIFSIVMLGTPLLFLMKMKLSKN